MGYTEQCERIAGLVGAITGHRVSARGQDTIIQTKPGPDTYPDFDVCLPSELRPRQFEQALSRINRGLDIASEQGAGSFTAVKAHPLSGDGVMRLMGIGRQVLTLDALARALETAQRELPIEKPGTLAVVAQGIAAGLRNLAKAVSLRK